MNGLTVSFLLGIDPALLFALSLLPYLVFLHWAARSGRLHPLALLGFRLTLLFVGVTIAASIWAELGFHSTLVDVDVLHGGAEAFLTLSNLLVVTGFALALDDSQPHRTRAPTDPYRPSRGSV